MIEIYFLRHIYQEEGRQKEIKDLGIYTTYKKALEAIDIFKPLEGFKKWPANFVISKLKVDQIIWTEFIDRNESEEQFG